MKYKLEKILLVILLIFIIIFSICPKSFAANENEIIISNKIGIGKTLEIVSGNASKIKSESITDVVNYLLTQGVIVNSIVDNKENNVEIDSTVLIGTGYVLDTSDGNYTVIVYGDGNGDGEVDAGDMKIIIEDFLGTKKVSPLVKIAVDLYKDGDLDAADLKQVLDSFLGNLKGNILNDTNTSIPNPTPTSNINPIGNGPQIKIGEDTITLTRQNVADYYGYIVTDYTAGNTTWRLFYVDFDGIYGEPGKMYLKADSVNMNNALGRRTLDAEASVNSIEALNKMKEMNPQWAYNDGVANLNNETAVLWLCDDSKWINFKDTEKADYVMGAPSLEMFVDSYNAYHIKKLTDEYEQLKCKWFNENGSGYKMRSAVGDESNYTEYKDLHAESDIMYLGSFWLASPCDKVFDDDKYHLCDVHEVSGNTRIKSETYDSTYEGNISPIVSLKSDYIPQLKYDSSSNMKIKFITCWNVNTAIRTGTKLEVYVNNKKYSVITALDTNGEAYLNHALQEGTNEIKVKTYYGYFGDYWGYDDYRTVIATVNGNHVTVVSQNKAALVPSYDEEKNEITIYTMFRTR